MKNIEHGISNIEVFTLSFCGFLLDIRYSIFIKSRIDFICAMTYLICLIILFLPAHVLAMDAYHVRRVVDGDTLLLDNNRFVRYIGINAPEVQHGNEHAEPFGFEAKTHNVRLVGNREIYLMYGQEKMDRYGRGLAYVYTPENVFINQMMLEQGWAYYLFKSPNLRFHDLFLKVQRLAMQRQQGMWCGWKVQALNLVGSKRSRRFHRETCSFGAQIGKSNRIIFTSLWEAFWAGYAPCKRCFPEGPFSVYTEK
ncbi:thermonuclease family protein [Thermodesulfobacteriota bacterium]